MNYRLSWFLREQTEAYHTLDELAAAVGQSLSQIGHDVERLEKSGFVLDRHPLMGLRLAEPPVAIDRDELAHVRPGRALGHTLRVYNQTGSTNDLAQQLARRGRQSDGVAILAEEQSAGRGRQGAAWFGSRGESLLLSVVHWAAPRPETPAGLMMATSIAVVEAIAEVTGLGAGIKWPNDLELRRRKIAGILIERGSVDGAAGLANSANPAAPAVPANSINPAGSGPAKLPYIIGLGLNVNQKARSFPPELAGRASSLRAELGRVVDRALLLRRLFEALERQLALADAGQVEKLLRLYRSHSDMIGREVTVVRGQDRFNGVVEAISPDYALVLRLENGGHRSFDASSVRLA